MFCPEDEDDSPKTPIVHPNDVLDIEISPIARSLFLLPPSGFEQRTPGTDGNLRSQKQASSVTKQKLKKSSKSNSSTTGGACKKNTAASMKRGDPFLPSVFSDENPIADFTVKKNSRKKPSDCKCKGFGYNLSPSALLPEEMRQQWGVGVFGKQVAIKPISASSSGGFNNSHIASVPSPSEVESSRYSVPNMTRLPYACNSNSSISMSVSGGGNHNNSSVYCPYRCMRCMRDQCICAEMNQIHEGFRIPDYSDKRKQKSVSKGVSSKGKDCKASTSGVIGSTLNTTLMKRSPCFSLKDNSNIISTSNFPKNSPSPVHLPPPGFLYNSDTAGMGTAIPLSKPVSMSKTCPSLGDPHQGSKSGGYMGTDHFTPSRPSSQPLMPRRVIANISPAPIISTGGLDAGAPQNFHTPKRPVAPRGVAQAPRRIVSQECACDSCRRRSNLMSTMEALGLSTSDSRQITPPFLLTQSPRYQPGRSSQPLLMPSRYSPYQVPPYRYKSTLRDIYGSPENYTRPSSPFYDYSEPPRLTLPAFSSTPVPVNQDVNRLDTSSLYLEADSSAMSPPSLYNSPWMVDDITDLSIKETVEFFLNMKPPIINSVPSPQSDTSSDMFSPSPGEHRCPSPGLGSGSNPCFCMGGWGSQQTPDRHCSRGSLDGFRDASQVKFSSGESSSVPYPPSSMLYSSLVSDLEDELRCAIENIPTS